MRLVILFICLIQLSGCAYKSIIISPKKNSDVYIGQNPDWNNDLFLQSHSILNDQIPLSKLLKQQNGGPGTYSVFLSNDQVFIEAKAEEQGSDTSTITGTYFNKYTRDTFSFVIHSSGIEGQMKKSDGSDDSFNFELVSRFDDFLDTTEQFHFSKARNYIIDKGICELYTGQVSSQYKGTYNYLVVNDPTKFSAPIKTVSFIYILVEEVELELEVICKDVFQSKCPEGYKVEMYNHKLLNQTIRCECKNNSK